MESVRPLLLSLLSAKVDVVGKCFCTTVDSRITMPRGYSCVNSAHTMVDTCRGTKYCRDCMLKNQRDRRKADPQYNRKNKLKSNYGMTPENYAALLHEQSGRCSLCRQPETRRLRGIVLSLCVDHEHTTGRIRSLLCSQCNMRVGLIETDIERTNAILCYIKAHSK